MDESVRRPTLTRIDGPSAAMSLSGDWTLRALNDRTADFRKKIEAAAPGSRWELDGIDRLDSFGAVLIWRAWGRKWPVALSISAEQREVIEAVASASAQPLPESKRFTLTDLVTRIGEAALGLSAHLLGVVRLVGQLALDLFYLMRRPSEWPLREISANLFKVGVRAMPVAALVGFLIGIVLSYLSALQLQAFGADVFIVNILGLGIVRELGPVLVSILVAGRSGSAMTAQLGVMRVTEEIDALSAMGISRTLRLVLPKMIALGIAMPLLVLWTSSIALFGGMVAAWLQLGLSFTYFLLALPDAVPLANVFIALSKGVVFGLLIALIACHFGLRVKPNTESLSANTTASVVSSITAVIMVDAVFAIATRSIGVPF